MSPGREESQRAVLSGAEEDACGGYSTDARLGTGDRVLSPGVARGGHRIREEPRVRDCKGK